jgi:hypothetical protein
MEINRKVLFLCFSLALLPSLWAVDLGMVLDQSVESTGAASEAATGYSGILVPRLSGLVGEYGEFYISAGFNWQNNPWGFVPELLQTDFFWRINRWDFRVGRMLYTDPMAVLAGGFFDGGRVTVDTAFGAFSVGAWYTGLLYKMRANIEMTPYDLDLSAVKLNYGDFADTYFAPRRFVSALDWEHQDIGEFLRLRFSFLSQFDLTRADEKLNSQYLTGKLLLPFSNFVFEAGGCFELIETAGNVDMAMAADLGAAWKNVNHRVSLVGRYSSGDNGSMVPFLPLTSIAQGYILKPKLSGISMISLDYTGRFHRSFSASLTSSYLMRTDETTYGFYTGSGLLLGPEFFAQLYWSPVSDISINLGGGAFLPSLGNVASDSEPLWRVELNVVISLY